MSGRSAAVGAPMPGGAGQLRSQLEQARLGLQILERDIRKVALQQATTRNPDRSFQKINSRAGPRLGKGGFGNQEARGFPERSEDNRQNKKRPQETKTVFSRLSARPVDSDNEDDASPAKKPRISSQVIRDLPSKQDVLKAQEGDEQSKARNRRIFGSLLGTLQKFKQESIVRQNKEDKKALIEKRIEEQAKLEKENQKKERQNLFAEREIKKATIKSLEAKMVRMREFEKWELSHTMILGFIQTKAKPNLFWKPKKMSEPAQEKWNVTRQKLEKTIEKKRQDVTAELNAIEQRCLRNVRLPPGSQAAHPAFENLPDYDQTENSEIGRTARSSVVIKKQNEDADRAPDNGTSGSKRDHERNSENGKSQAGGKWNRDESDSSSDENDHSPKNADEKDHSMDESSRMNENGEDPGGTAAKESEDASPMAANDA